MITVGAFFGRIGLPPVVMGWAGLPPAMMGQVFLSKGVETGPTATQLGPACAQTMSPVSTAD